jgi:spore germination protein
MAQFPKIHMSKLKSLFEKAESRSVRKVVTLTMMERVDIESFLSNPNAWEKTSYSSVDIIKSNNLDGVNIDFEYIPRNDRLKKNFSLFIDTYVEILNKELEDPYITVSVLASSVRFNKIYDISHLAKKTDGVFMMAYDFYYSGSDFIGPSAPLYGYNDGKGPFWYDVSTAVDDFLSVARADKIIMGVPYYGWNYPAVEGGPKSLRNYGRAFATTLEKAGENRLISTTPIGGWDDTAKVSWRGYWDETGWHIVYLEDELSLSYKYKFARERGLGGVGIWALGYDDGDDNLWMVIKESFNNYYLSSNKNSTWDLF